MAVFVRRRPISYRVCVRFHPSPESLFGFSDPQYVSPGTGTGGQLDCRAGRIICYANPPDGTRFYVSVGLIYCALPGFCAPRCTGHRRESIVLMTSLQCFFPWVVSSGFRFTAEKILLFLLILCYIEARAINFVLEQILPLL